VRRLIPKSNGKLRPLGLPALEDKIVAKAVAMLLEAIYEQDFCDCSYGFRPGRSPHQALHAVRQGPHSIGFSGRPNGLRSPHRPRSATEDGDQSPRMPYVSEAWTFWPRKEVAGVADAMIKADQWPQKVRATRTAIPRCSTTVRRRFVA